MVTKAIKLYKTKGDKIPYLTTILEEIPTDTILCKTLTGLGATYGEKQMRRFRITVRLYKSELSAGSRSYGAIKKGATSV